MKIKTVLTGLGICLFLTLVLVVISTLFFRNVAATYVGFDREKVEEIVTPDPEKNDSKHISTVVLNYCQLATNEDYLEIKKIITHTPSQYWVYRLQEASRSSRDENIKSVQLAEQSVAGTSSDDKMLDEMNYRTISVSKVLAFKGIILPPKRIEGIWVKDDFARMRVSFDTEKKLPFPFELDFFLAKSNETWKIFYIRFGFEGEKYPL